MKNPTSKSRQKGVIIINLYFLDFHLTLTTEITERRSRIGLIDVLTQQFIVFFMAADPKPKQSIGTSTATAR